MFIKLYLADWSNKITEFLKDYRVVSIGELNAI
jgi:hypothetical protein